ncbi:MAG: hypothetical protein GY862_37470 [Gammaproteobacteria bacterium]|nr:hypothetical protein [Gammaproteobacteria bacterium]
MINNLYTFKKMLDEHDILLAFSGPLSQKLLVEIGDMLRNKMKQEEASSSTTTKVFSMLIEQAQNIIHHSNENMIKENQEPALSNGVLLVGHDQTYYYVLCGNKIKNESVQPLSKRLLTLQSMSKDELKRYYKEQRRKDPPKHSKGAGLGFIELARKSVRAIEFNFQSIDENFSFFSLKTYI